ncbi:unnamed protein product [Hymenolepis diminuta]|uniref:MARVEL domain-containing protein n=1 Tax=Hymenolepis diminuta TaxID=6216 RepID=A0A0R3S9U0_HYMDI|nr:unnamed protein product [Hymenolepis diminuta]VUZ56077.1 unnamed protein product [Hymenolepis diminuta]
MLESIFFIVTTLFALLFLILSVALESWPCGGVFSDSCQNNTANYPTKSVGALICIAIILYVVSAVIDLCQMYLQALDDGLRKILAYVAIGVSGFGSLLVVSGMLAFFNLYLHSWSVMLSVVGMTLGCSLTFQLAMRMIFDNLTSVGGEN